MSYRETFHKYVYFFRYNHTFIYIPTLSQGMYQQFEQNHVNISIRWKDYLLHIYGQ